MLDKYLINQATCPEGSLQVLMALMDTDGSSYSLASVSSSPWSMAYCLQNTMTLRDDWLILSLSLTLAQQPRPCVPSLQTLQPLVTAGLRPLPVSTSQLLLALCLIQYAILPGSSA